MPRRGRTVYVNGLGYVTAKRTQDANYEQLGEGWKFLIAAFRYFPDFLCDLLRADDAEYELNFMQRLILRVNARYQFVYITGCRGLTKSYSTVLEEQCEMCLFPRIKIAYYGPAFKQTARIASQIYKEISRNYPALAKHLTLEQDSAVGDFKLTSEYGSELNISAFRGTTVNKVVVEEMAQEELPKFDHEKYKQVVVPAVRGRYYVNGKPSPAYIDFKQHVITSAGRRQNPAFDLRCAFKKVMDRGGSAFVMDVPYQVVLLLGMRPISWAETIRSNLTPDQWMREMESKYTGADQNALIPDSTISSCRNLLLMEEHHCCKDYSNKLKPDEVFYIIGYDVSYADGADNAKCACVVVKCTKQEQYSKRNRYLKEVVWVDDWAPSTEIEQATKIKKIWNRFSVAGSRAYIAIDCWQYGQAVTTSLMRDLGDGLSPLCIYNHTQFVDLELVGAEDVIYPIKAGGAGTTDPEAEMIRNCELQFDNENVRLLTSEYRAGIDAYKQYHRIKDDNADYIIHKPYRKTDELVQQLQNLQKVPNANGVSEKRISKRIQRDSWSALKYALRLAQILEQTFLMRTRRESDWDNLLKQYENKSFNATIGANGNSNYRSRRVTSARKGRMF